MRCCSGDWSGLCFVVINPCVLSANRFFLFKIFSILLPPPPSRQVFAQFPSLALPVHAATPQVRRCVDCDSVLAIVVVYPSQFLGWYPVKRYHILKQGANPETGSNKPQLEPKPSVTCVIFIYFYKSRCVGSKNVVAIILTKICNFQTVVKMTLPTLSVRMSMTIFWIGTLFTFLIRQNNVFQSKRSVHSLYLKFLNNRGPQH